MVNTRSTGVGPASVNAEHRCWVQEQRVRVLGVITINTDLEHENDKHKIRCSISKCGCWAQELRAQMLDTRTVISQQGNSGGTGVGQENFNAHGELPTILRNVDLEKIARGEGVPGDWLCGSVR